MCKERYRSPLTLIVLKHATSDLPHQGNVQQDLEHWPLISCTHASGLLYALVMMDWSRTRPSLATIKDKYYDMFRKNQPLEASTVDDKGWLPLIHKK
jgi:hypothetical protein